MSRIEILCWLIFFLSIGVIIFDVIIVRYFARYKVKAPEIPADMEEAADSVGGEAAPPAAAREKPAASSAPFFKQRTREKKTPGEYFIEQGIITQEILNLALAHQREHGTAVTIYLLHYGHITEKQLAQCYCAQYGVPYLPLASFSISPEVIKFIPYDLVEKNWILPVDRHGDCLTVVMIDPLDTRLVREIEEQTSFKVVPYVSLISEIMVKLKEYYKLSPTDANVRVPPFMVLNRDYSGIERRTSIRYPAKIGVQFPLGDKYVRSQTINISRGGFMFTSPQALPMNSFLILEVDLPPAMSLMPITAVTEVVRCLPLEGGAFEIGVMTHKVLKSDVNLIVSYAVAQTRGL